MYRIKPKRKKFADFIIFFPEFSKFYKNKKILIANFLNFDHSYSLGFGEVPRKIWARSVQQFIGYKQTDTHRQAKFIYRLAFAWTVR